MIESLTVSDWCDIVECIAFCILLGSSVLWLFFNSISVNRESKAKVRLFNARAKLLEEECESK